MIAAKTGPTFGYNALAGRDRFAAERILVLILGDAAPSVLVRAGSRLSRSLHDAPWVVVQVEPAGRAAPDPRALAAALALAETLGGSVVTLAGDDPETAITGYMARSGATQLVLGKSRPDWWRWRPGGDMPARILKRSGDAAVHLIADASAGGPDGPAAAQVAGRRFWRFDVRDYLYAMALVGLAGAVSAGLDRYASRGSLAMIFLAGVLTSGLLNGLGPAVLAAALAIFTYNFFFLDPRFTLVISRGDDAVTFTILLAVASGVGWLSGQVRDRGRRSAQRATAIAALLATSRRLSATATRAAAAQVVAEQAAATAGLGALVLLPGEEGVERVAQAPSSLSPSAAVLAAADRAWSHGGAEAGACGEPGWMLRPMVGVRGPVGLLALRMAEERSAEDERLLDSLLDQGAVAIERAELAAAEMQVEALRRSDELRAALLNSVSHDLRTPLATVLGAVTTMIEYPVELEAEVRGDLLESIREEAERLSRYVENLLDMTRIEGGALKPRCKPTAIGEVLAAATDRVEGRLGRRDLRLSYSEALPALLLDAALLEQAVVNVLENAIAYSPETARIEASVHETPDALVICIEDDGPGIRPSELERIFERFRRLEENSDRVRGDRTKGVGLGLSISKGFVEAMGGRISAFSPTQADHGTRIRIAFPKTLAFQAAAPDTLALNGLALRPEPD